MKKLTALLLALLLLFTVSASVAESFLGKWYLYSSVSDGHETFADDAGFVSELVLKKRGKAVMVLMGFESQGTWNYENGKLSLTFNNISHKAKVANGKLSLLSDDGSKLVYNRLAAVEYNHGVYRVNKNKAAAIFTGAAVTAFTESSLVISDTVKIEGKTYKVTEIRAGACKLLSNLTTLTIGKNIEKIGKNLLQSCGALKTIKVKTAKLTKKGIASGCFSYLNDNVVFQVPKKMLQKYQTWFVKVGKAPAAVTFEPLR